MTFCYIVKSQNQDTNENGTDDVAPTNQEMQLPETNSPTCQINKRKRRNNTYGGNITRSFSYNKGFYLILIFIIMI